MSLADSVELPTARLPHPQSHQKAVQCRVCNVLSSNCLPLFKQHSIAGKITTLAKVLLYCTGLEILEGEHFLPQHICPECMAKMQASLQFKRNVHRMDRMLRQRHMERRSKLAKDTPSRARQESGNAKRVSGEYIFVLDEQREATQEETPHLEIELEQGVETNTEPREGHSMEIEVNISQETTEPESGTQEPQKERENPIEIAEEDQLVKELSEDDLREVVEEPEDQEDTKESSLVVDSDLPKPPKSLISRKHRLKTQNPSLQCKICGKQLSTSNSFKYHMQLHGTATPYVCHICGESFKTRNAHDGHVTLHDPNNPNRCLTCGKVYRQASSLRSHLLTHSGIKPFECTVCGKRLTQKSGYKKHMLTHTGEKPHGCDICGRSFRYSSNLIAHKRCHSQEKPHECQVCHKRSFGSTSELNRHMLVHSSERPFACGECGKSFKRQVSLGLHQQSHKGGGNKWGKVVAVVQEKEDHEET